jgi:uncharacterized protein (DUF1697 family)
MAWVVLLRAVNVGGARRFQPSGLAKELTDLDVTGLGAAGTFVVRAPVTERALRRRIEQALPFGTEILVCPAKEIQELIRSDPFEKAPSGAKPYLTVLVAPSVVALSLPYHVPPAPDWDVQVQEVRGRYVLSVARRLTDRLTYPNPVVEKALHVGATTRGWATVLSIDERLRAS